MNYFQEITLNGQTYFKEELVKIVRKKLGEETISDFKKALYTFIGDWISGSNTITVKTSGTTGTPKEIKFRKEQFVHSALMTCEFFNLSRKSRGLLCLSPEYIAGKMMIVRAFVSGMDLITLEPTNKPLVGMAERIDFAAFVPLQVQNLCSDEITKKRFQSIRNVIIGGAAIPGILEKELENYPNRIYSTFSMTETLSHVALRKLSGKKKDEYMALPGVHFEKDKRGCLVVNAPLVSDTKVVTNDVVELADSSHFKWIGRYDDVINSGGIKLYPAEIEKKIEPLITNHRFFIASLPDHKLGQKVVLVLEGIKEMELSKLKAKIKAQVSKYEMPKAFYYIPQFIETETGKVKRNETLSASDLI